MYPSQRTTSALLLLVIAATWILPPDPAEQAMHGSLTVVALVLLWRYAARLQVSDRDLFFVALFLAVHSVAARWMYSYVPYDAWGQSLFGFSINAHMGWKRNHFDRLVHFLFGVCFTPGIASYVMRRYQITPRRALVAAVCAIMIASLWYEWFELAIAMTLSGKDAEAYNGQQGDMWDAHLSARARHSVAKTTRWPLQLFCLQKNSVLNIDSIFLCPKIKPHVAELS